MNPTPDYTLPEIPPEVTGAANLVADWMNRNGHTRWELMEICSRNHAAELEQAKQENEALANLLWEHPTAPCDQDSVFASMDRVKQLRADLASAQAKLAKISRVIEAMEKLDDSMTDAQIAAESTLREAIAITVESDTAEQLATAQLRIKLLLLQQAHEESVRAEMKTELIHAGNELERLRKKSAVVEDFSKIREERDQLKERSVPIDPSISDKFEIKDHSVFVIRNGTAYLAGIRELADMTELVDARNELAKLRAELEKLKAENSTFLFELSIWSKADAVLDADPSSTDDPCYINIQRIISQRDQWRAVADCLFNVLTEDETNCEAYMNACDSYKLALKGESAQ